MLLESPVAEIEMDTKDWKRIALVISNVDEIAIVLYPTTRKKDELKPKEKAGQWARQHFKAMLENAVVSTESDQAEGTTRIYILLAGVGAIIQAMDAVLEDEALRSRIYQRHRFSEVTMLCKYIRVRKGVHEEAPLTTSSMAIDEDLLNDFNDMVMDAEKVNDLRSFIE